MASLMNGLSALGAGVSAFAGSAGLEQQKADLAKQQTILADQLAGARQDKQNVFTAGENTANRQNLVDVTNIQGTTSRDVAGIGAGATLGAANIQGATARDVATINANSPPDVIKTLRALGYTLPGDAAPSAPAPAASSDSGGSAPSPSGTSAAPGPNDDLKNSLLYKALGQPMPGSEPAVRAAIVKDIDADPNFKGKTVGQKATELENRLAIAQGKMTDPVSRDSMAAGIASYQLAPLSGFSLTKPGGPETMAKVMQLNPDYQEGRYPEVNKAMVAFATGKQGDIVRSLNVGVQHLDTLDQAAAALNNGNVQFINKMGNTFLQQFGAAAPTTFDGLKHIVGTEIEKAVAGGIGSDADRQRLMDALNRANSPAQLQAITAGFRNLMGGQLRGLKDQYEEATGFKDGPFTFEKKLAPATAATLTPHAPGVTPAASDNLPDPLGIR